MKQAPNASGESGKSPRSLFTALGILLLSMPFIVQALLLLYELGRRIVTRNDTTYPEGEIVYGFLLSVRTEMLYSNPFLPPYDEKGYGPIFYIVGTCAAWLAHGSVLLTAEVMRSFALLCFLASALVVGYIVWRLELHRGLAFSAIVFCLACAWPVPFCASTRPDSLAILLIFLALAIYISSPNSRPSPIFWAGVLGGMSCFTKQTMAPVLLALFLDALLAKRFRSVFILLAGSLSGPLVILGTLLLRHEPVLQNLAIPRYSATSTAGILPFLETSVVLNELALVVLLFSLVGFVSCWKLPSYRPILLVGILGIVSGIYAISNTGSDMNYLILPSMLASLFAPLGILRLAQWTRSPIAVALATFLVGGYIVFTQRGLLHQPPPPNLNVSSLSNRRVLTDVSYLEALTVDPEYMDPFFFNQLDQKGAWSIEPIVAEIDSGTFDLILLSGREVGGHAGFEVAHAKGMSFWPEKTIDAMQRSYKTLCALPKEVALVPKDGPDSVTERDIEARLRPTLCSDRRISS